MNNNRQWIAIMTHTVHILFCFAVVRRQSYFKESITSNHKTWWYNHNTKTKHVRIFQEIHDDVAKWKHFPRYWPFVRGFPRSPMNSPHNSQWRGALIFSLICARINGWVNNGEASDLTRHRAHYDGMYSIWIDLSVTKLAGCFMNYIDHLFQY